MIDVNLRNMLNKLLETNCHDLNSSNYKIIVITEEQKKSRLKKIKCEVTVGPCKKKKKRKAILKRRHAVARLIKCILRNKDFLGAREKPFYIEFRCKLVKKG